MAMDLSYFPFLFSLFLFITSLLFITNYPKSEQKNLPPGPRKLPAIGNLHHFFTSLAPHRVLANLSAKYGALMHLRLGEVSTFVISSPEFAKEIMKIHDINFANRPSFFASEIIFYNNSDIGTAPYGEYWRQLRKICTLELLSAKRVQFFQPLRGKEFANMCQFIASNEGSGIDLTGRVELTMCDIFTQAAIGKKTDKQDVLISSIKEAVDLGAGLSLADVYPSIKMLRYIGGMKGKLERLHKIIDDILEDIIGDHKRRGDECKHREDVFTAGIETSSTTVDWAMAELLRHPKALHEAQEEVRRVFEGKGFADESNFDQLKYLELVIKETLRMHPPVPLLIPRENLEACEINGYKVAAKTRIIVNAWAIGRDLTKWKDPESFVPERFLDVAVDYKGNHFEFIPFGAGRRMCPGMTFGLAHVVLPLAMLLYHFDWDVRGNIDMAESFGATSRRKNPLYVIPTVRNPLPVLES
ncbi:cytochrome P450 71D9-like isoform X2 [Andrographis paniculata]|uniref:cytochrome P450 71D9-like isoform X2 n=1 Tax=Andrographis paniculata TaxID=175694 RepID=UPI0021E75378|nr:cytochrome P450 71D9-like isoform X2 [Andrographis paniculata]